MSMAVWIIHHRANMILWMMRRVGAAAGRLCISNISTLCMVIDTAGLTWSAMCAMSTLRARAAIAPTSKRKPIIKKLPGGAGGAFAPYRPSALLHVRGGSTLQSVPSGL
jgi:hypothetical protein